MAGGAENSGAEDGGDAGAGSGHAADPSTGKGHGNAVGGSTGGGGLLPPPDLPPPPSVDEIESRGAVVVPPPPLPDTHHGLGIAGVPPTVPMGSRASSSSSAGSGGPGGMGSMHKPPKGSDPSKSLGGGASKPPLRRGKWTFQEEAYVSRIIHDFNQGLLPLTAGTTLRAYLSDTLNCDPMVRLGPKIGGWMLDRGDGWPVDSLTHTARESCTPTDHNLLSYHTHTP